MIRKLHTMLFPVFPLTDTGHAMVRLSSMWDFL
jgi:hypothetical protein